MSQTMIGTNNGNDPKRNVWVIVWKVVVAAVATLMGALGLQSCL